MSTNPERSKPARIGTLLRQAKEAEERGRVAEAASFLQEVVQLDPRDRRTLHRLGDLFRIGLNRFREAAAWYAREARLQEEEGFHGRAIGLWRLVARCDPARVEAHERIGALYAETGRLADARLHYERSERLLREAGLGREAAILRAQGEALEEAAVLPPGPTSAPPPAAGPGSFDPAEDDEARDLAADRLSNGRVYHHFGLHAEARRQLEELLAVQPEHVEARQLLAEVCRAPGDSEAAARHLDVLLRVMRGRGLAAPLTVDEPVDLPAIEEWDLECADRDPFAEIFDEIRGEVERLVESIQREGKK